ncbi:MAG: superoxide dismutase, partial [Candidatus Eiseniibacteriota bacterium]
MMSRRDALKSLALSSGALMVVNSLPRMARNAAAQGSEPTTAAPAAPAAPSGPFTLPALPYAYDALEPYIDVQTMQIHHDKHHQAYVNNLNKAVAGHPDLAARKVEDLLRGLDKIPADFRQAIRNQGGGHANHSLLWTSLKKDPAAAPSGELATGIDAAFRSFSAFQDKFSAAAMSVFGSGWAWLTWEKEIGLAIETTPNQDSPLSVGRVPLLGIDVW